MAEAAAGVLYGVEKVIEGATLAVKGIYDPTLPLKATLTPLTSIDVPLAYHSMSIIKGRAYLFGGKTQSKDGGESLSDNSMHVVILPSSGMESTDYKKIEASNDAPPKRYAHSAAVIEDRIYIFGGYAENGELMEENGRVWVFDTLSSKWSHHDPPGHSARPDARADCSAVATEHPRPVEKNPEEGMLPQDPPDPETIMPEIPDAGSYGTFIVQGGKGKDDKLLNDLWSFDISTKTWTELPSPPPPISFNPSLALIGSRIYSFSLGQTSYLNLTAGFHDDRGGKGELGIAPLAPWQSISPASSSPEHPYPGERSGSALIPVTTGQGRNYLILLGGESQGGDVEEDIWALQLKPEGMTAASFKDAARMAIKKDTNEQQWSELKYLNADGVMIQEGQQGRGIGPRKGMAAAKEVDVDGASVVVWGGIRADGKPRGDGLMVSVGT